MAIQETFDVKTVIDGEEKEIKIRMMEVNPLIAADVLGESLGKNGLYKPGSLIAKCVSSGIIISPKNIIETIEKSDDGLQLITDMFEDVYRFCKSPKKYGKFKEYKAKSLQQREDMGDSVQ